MQILKEKMPLCLKTKLYTKCILHMASCKAEIVGLSKKREINWNTNDSKEGWGMLRATFRDQNSYVGLKTYTIAAINSVSGYRENQDVFCQAGYGTCSPK